MDRFNRSRRRAGMFARLALLLLAAVAVSCSSNSDKQANDAPSSAAQGTPAPAARGSKLTMAVLPTNTPEQLEADAKQIEQFLAQRLNRDVELLFPTTYAGVIEALRFGYAQAAFMSAWPLALAAKNAGAEVGLAEVREVVVGDQKKEEPFYYSYWVVKKDSPITSLEQLRGKKVALPSALSTSGYVAPVARLVELGLVTREPQKEVDPRKFFGEVLLAGGYAQGWEALKKGQVDATVIAGDVPEALYREVLANTRVIEQQGPIPSHGVAFAKNLDSATKTELKAALMDLGKPENRELMRKFISGIFVSFKPTTAEEHLASLNKDLELTNFEFVERLR